MHLVSIVYNIHQFSSLDQLSLSLFLFIMSTRYKDDTFHMLETFNKTAKKNTGFGLTQNLKNQTVRGKTGNTWDAKHMTCFLSQSNYSNWSGSPSENQESNDYLKHRRYNSTHDHFFKTTKDNKNASKIGYSKINPLVSLPEPKAHNIRVLNQFLSSQSPERYSKPRPAMIKDGKFLYQGNSIKFRTTDPLTLQHLQQKRPSQFDKQRLLYLMNKRHPHGMTGIDHPDKQDPYFYQAGGMKEVQMRQEPRNHRTHLLDRDWKSKGRVSPAYKEEYGFPKAQIIQERKFRNDDIHGFNIITNCQTHR